jgi:hypothetical protein
MRTQHLFRNSACFAALQRNLVVLALCGLTTFLTGISQRPQTSGEASPAAVRKAFTEGEILELLKLETPDALLIRQVRAAGINFDPGQREIDDLVKAGASNALLVAIYDVARNRAFAQHKIVELLQQGTPDVLLIPQVRVAGIAFTPGQKDIDELVKAGASNALLAVIFEAADRWIARFDSEGVEERARLGAASYKAEGDLVAAIISIREGPEDAIIGHRDNGDYFKATASAWILLGPNDVNGLSQDVKNDLSRKVEHPLVWLVNRKHLDDDDKVYDQMFENLMNNARIAQFGGLSGNYIITIFNPRVPNSALIRDGYYCSSRLPFCSLSSDHCGAAQMLRGSKMP